MRVIDYDANSGALLATPPDQELPVVGTQRDGLWCPGSVNVAVGDFDANGRNEIAVTWQDAGGLNLTVLRYAATESGSRELTVIGKTQKLDAVSTTTVGRAAR